jgi:hypothetical protein
MLDVLIRSDFALLYQDAKEANALRALLADFEFSVERFLNRAPERTDMAIPFLAWKINAGKEAEALAFSNRMLRRDEHDRVALWFSGTVLLGRSETASLGIKRLKEALEQGIGRIYPVPPDVAKMIRSAHEN